MTLWTAGGVLIDWLRMNGEMIRVDMEYTKSNCIKLAMHIGSNCV